MEDLREFEFILYVKNQGKSKYFYEQLLGINPCLDVPGMTEFRFANGVKLGLMPENGIVSLLKNKIPHPALANEVPRCELYLKVSDAQAYMQRGIQLGAREISKLEKRDWGDCVGYLADFDGHIVAFAENAPPQ